MCPYHEHELVVYVCAQRVTHRVLRSGNIKNSGATHSGYGVGAAGGARGGLDKVRGRGTVRGSNGGELVLRARARVVQAVEIECKGGL